MVYVSLAAMVGSASARAVFVSLLFVATMLLATVASHAATCLTARCIPRREHLQPRLFPDEGPGNR